MSNRKRSRARKLALQALYQNHFNPASPQQLIDQFRLEHYALEVDWELFTDLIRQTLAKPEMLDAAFGHYLSRPSTQLDPIELQLLRLASCELLHHAESPSRSVIDDAVHLARNFGAQDSYKLINAVLDKFVRQLDWRSADMRG